MEKTIKIGQFPGEIKEYAVDANATVREVLDMAGITVANDSMVKADGSEVSLDSTVENYRTILVTRRLKGAF